MKTLHEKIIALKAKQGPVRMSGSYVDAKGHLVEPDFKIKASASDRTVEGYLAVWGSIDANYREVMMPGCYLKSIAERGPASASKQKIAFLWCHDTCDPIGRFLELKEDTYGLRFKAELDEVPSGDRALTQMRSGTINQFSTGVKDVWDQMEYDSATDTVKVYETKLMEGSPVVFGSDPETYVIKSEQDFIDKRVELMDAIEDFIMSIPRERQLECRQLITKHILLAEQQPVTPTKDKRLDLSLPESTLVVGGYKLNLKQF